MTLEDRAVRLSKPDLIRLLSAVCGVEAYVDDIIDRNLAAGEGSGNERAVLAQTLSAQLRQIADKDEFYGYRGSYAFSERLSSILSAIDNLLRPQDPQAALNLTEAFLALADEAFQQLASIIEFALAIGELDRAGYWLEQPQWQDDQSRYRSLRYLWLRRKGDTGQLKKELQKDFTKRPHRYTLEPLWLMASDTEKRQLKQQVETFSSNDVDLEELVSMLLLADGLERAETVMLEHPGQFSTVHYGTLLSWAKKFAEEHRPLAQVVCYRALLTDLLDRGYARAYRHGAGYFHQLLALDNVIDDYRGLEDASAFIKGLQTRHWRKRSFWELGDYPNKPPKD